MNATDQAAVYAAITVDNGGRLVPAKLQGVTVYIPCPDWCTKDHAGETLMFMDDLNHVGPAIEVTVPTFGGGTEEALDAMLVQWPHCERGRVYVSLRSPSEDCTDLTAGAASEFAEQLIAHGVALRKMAQQLAALEG